MCWAPSPTRAPSKPTPAPSRSRRRWESSNFRCNALTAGTWSALNGATLQLPVGFSTNAGNLVLGGSGASISGMSGLRSNTGSVTVSNGAAFSTTGAFSNSGTLTLGVNSTLTVNGAFTQSATGNLIEQIGGLSASNAFGQATITGAANLGGNFTLNVVNSFTPVAGQTYQVLTFASSSGSFARLTGLGSTFTQALGSTSFVLGTFSNPVDLAVSNVTAPANAVVGQSITVGWQTNNQTNQASAAIWQDSVYLSPTAAITANSILLASVVHASGIAANGAYQGSLTANLPALAPANYYVLVQVDSLY